MGDYFRFSVFTPTYNRARFLTRAYKSLAEQVYKDFEWVVVDDGSDDNTEELIRNFISENRLRSIRYIKKENGGKHTAWRIATPEFSSKYVVTLDSDDMLLPTALEVFNRYWTELEQSSDFDEFWEVKGRTCDENGKLIGTPLPKNVIDSNAEEITYKYRVKGEMEGCRKVAVLRNEAKVPDSFIFQEKCSNFPEGVRWARAGKKYKTRYFDEVRLFQNSLSEVFF